MKVVAFVPIKMTNRRTPGKNTKRFDDGTPLIHFILRKLLNVSQIDEVYVYCSNDEIKDYLIDGVKFKQRSKELDSDTTASQDIISSFIKEVDADIYVLSHATSPFVETKRFCECINKIVNENYDSAFTAEKLQNLLWCKNKPLNFDPQNVPRTQDLEPIYNEVSAAYVFKKEVFINHKRRIGVNPYICEVSKIESVDIDYPEDFQIANAIYMKLIKN
jgi:CMP-N-acetylneuraminic acid synthetase